MTNERFFIKKILDIRYRDHNNQNKNKQIIINTKIVPQSQYQNINLLREFLESEVFVVYDNKMYSSNYYKNKYKSIIETTIDTKTLIYVSQYSYIDSYPI